jgi:hypothetical protein
MKSTVLEQMNAVFVAAVDSMCEYILRVFSDIENSQGLEKAEEFLQEELTCDNMFNLEVVQPIFCLDPFLEGCHQYVSFFSERDVRMKAEYECIVEAITKAKKIRAVNKIISEMGDKLIHSVWDENSECNSVSLATRLCAGHLISVWNESFADADDPLSFLADIEKAIAYLKYWHSLAAPILKEYSYKVKDLQLIP